MVWSTRLDSLSPPPRPDARAAFELALAEALSARPEGASQQAFLVFLHDSIWDRFTDRWPREAPSDELCRVFWAWTDEAGPAVASAAQWGAFLREWRRQAIELERSRGWARKGLARRQAPAGAHSCVRPFSLARSDFEAKLLGRVDAQPSDMPIVSLLPALIDCAPEERKQRLVRGSKSSKQALGLAKRRLELRLLDARRLGFRRGERPEKSRAHARRREARHRGEVLRILLAIAERLLGSGELPPRAKPLRGLAEAFPDGSDEEPRIATGLALLEALRKAGQIRLAADAGGALARPVEGGAALLARRL
jgi:hypothetical protein